MAKRRGRPPGTKNKNPKTKAPKVKRGRRKAARAQGDNQIVIGSALSHPSVNGDECLTLLNTIKSWGAQEFEVSVGATTLKGTWKPEVALLHQEIGSLKDEIARLSDANSQLAKIEKAAQHVNVTVWQPEPTQQAQEAAA